MAVPAGIPSIAQQEMAVNAKINRAREQGRGMFTPSAEDAAQQWVDFKSFSKNFGKGLPANALGLPVDLMGMLVMGGYSGYNYLVRGGDFTMPDFKKVPGSSESFGELFGADTTSGGFIASAFTNPEGAPMAAFKLLKAAAVAVKGAGVVSAGIGGLAVAARNIPGEVARQATAAKMLEKGKSTDEIFQQTGWWKDPDGWKFYISDKDAVTNMGPIEDAAANAKVAIGQQFSVDATLGDFLTHDKYFQAYPHFAETPTRMWARRIKDKPDGTPDFEIFNQRAFDRKIQAEVATDTAGFKEITVFNKADDMWDNARSIILHEANHLPQMSEGFDLGANVAKFRGRIANASKSSVTNTVAQDLADGVIHKGMSKIERHEYAVTLASNNRLVTEDTAKWALNDLLARNLDEAEVVQLAGRQATNHQQNIRDVRIMMEELGDIPKGKGVEEIQRMIAKMTEQDQHDLAFRRYRNQGGEIGSNLTEELSNLNAAEIRARGEVPNLEGPIASRVMQPGDPVVGDAARASQFGNR